MKKGRPGGTLPDWPGVEYRKGVDIVICVDRREPTEQTGCSAGVAEHGTIRLRAAGRSWERRNHDVYLMRELG